MGTLSRQELKDMLLVYFMDQWWYCTVEWLLWYIWDIMAGCSSHGCCMKASTFCTRSHTAKWIHLQHYTVRLWTTLFRVPIWCPSNDLHIFGLLKKHLPGKRGAADREMKQTVISWLQTLDTYFFCAEIQVLVPWWDKCLNVGLPTWRPDVYHVLRTCHAHVEVWMMFRTWVFVNLFFESPSYSTL